jgi:hypothetical protein
MKYAWVIIFLSFSLHAMENSNGKENPMQEVFNGWLDQYLDNEIKKNPEKYKVGPVSPSPLKNEIAKIVCKFIKYPSNLDYKKKETALEWMMQFADSLKPKPQVKYENTDKSMSISFWLSPTPTPHGILNLKNLPPTVVYRIIATIETKNSIYALEKNSDDKFIGVQLLAALKKQKELKESQSGSCLDPLEAVDEMISYKLHPQSKKLEIYVDKLKLAHFMPDALLE